MKKRLITILVVVLIYIPIFCIGEKMYMNHRRAERLESYTEVFCEVITEMLQKDKYAQITDLEYVRTEYQTNEQGLQYYTPTVYFSSEQFAKLSDEDKTRFFHACSSGHSFRVAVNGDNHGGIHILSDSNEYTWRHGLRNEGALYKNGVNIYGTSSLGGKVHNSEYYRYTVNTELLLIGAVCIAGIMILVFVVIDSNKKKRKKKEARIQAEREEAAEKLRKEALMRAMNDHTWAFPAQSLYEKCVDAGIKDNLTDFSRKKIQQMAKKILDENHVPETAQEWYINHAAQFFDKGMAAVQGEVNAWKTTLHTADLDEEAAAFLSSASRIKTLYGAQKRQFLLQTKLDELSKRHAALTGAKYTPVLEKEKNWATHGGIASGLAGPGAGIATALNTMQENEKIRERNALQREAVSAVNTYFQAHANSVWDQISGVRKELDVLPDKIVLDNISAAELLDAYRISVRAIERISSGDDLKSREKNQRGMWIYFTIRQVRSLNLDIPKSARIVLDGSIVGKVFTAKEQKHSICPVDAEVAEFAAPLDIYGIPYYNNLSDDQKGRVYEVKALCDHFYGDVNTAYVCRLASKQNLWLMER